MRILMIHGRSQGGNNPEDLKEIWINTLKEGFQNANLVFPENLSIDFPFYGDILDKFTEQAKLPISPEVISKGSGQNKNFEEFIQSAILEIKRNANIKDEDIEFSTTDKSHQEKGIQNWRWIHAIVRKIDDYLTDVSDFTIETFLRDVYLYVNIPIVTSTINKIIENEISNEPTIIIGHSLGSVVGYKVVTNNLKTINHVKYITLGSPLGLKAISSKLGLLNNPFGVNGWYNAFDNRDIVALNPLDTNHFPTNPFINNNNNINNFTSNRHGIEGYLNDPNVAIQINKHC